MRTKTLLLATSRNEGPYLVEWIAYHRALGFDGILLVTNSNTDGSDALISRLVQAGVVMHIDNSTLAGTESFAQYERDNIQIRAYVRAHRSSFFQEHDWVAILDIDEFLVLKGHDNVGDFIETKDADGIAINWRNFGSSSEITFADVPVTKRFHRCALREWRWNAYIKSISRVIAIRKLAGAHYSYLRHGMDKFVYCSGVPMTSYHDESNIDFSEAQINHYAIKSLDEFLTKRSRGDGMKDPSSAAAGTKYNLDYFKLHDRNECEDLSIGRLASALAEQMTAIMAIDGVRIAHDACVEHMRARIAEARAAMLVS